MSTVPLIPGINAPLQIPMIPSLTGGAGGAAQAGATSNSGVSNPIGTPFNFDGSGWNVNIHGSGDQSATGNTGANTGTASGSSVAPPKNWLLYAGAAVVIWLIARQS